MEDEQNRHSTGFMWKHARSVDRASHGMTTLWKTSRHGHGKKPFS